MISRYGEKMWLEQKKVTSFQATLESSQCSSPFQNMVFALLPFSLGSHTAANSIFVQWWLQKTLFAVQIWAELLCSAGGLLKIHGLVYGIPLNGYLGSQSVKKTCWEKKILAGSLICKMLSNICFPKLQREAN